MVPDLSDDVPWSEAKEGEGNDQYLYLSISYHYSPAKIEEISEKLEFPCFSNTVPKSLTINTRPRGLNIKYLCRDLE